MITTTQLTAPGMFLEQMRSKAPLVQNITNFVAMNVMANAMLAAGASPAMVHAEEEVAEFVPIAAALSINIGTANGAWAPAMRLAAKTAHEIGRPWVLDPVAVGATRFRRALCADLLAFSPTVVRGNASEIIALEGGDAAGKGADAADPVAAAEAAATRLARRLNATVAVTGPVDFVTDGTRAVRVANGDPMMPRITALGCSLTGIMAAFAVGQDPFDATVAALAYFGLAGEIAAKQAQGPGSFATGFIDALYRITPDALNAGAKLEAA